MLVIAGDMPTEKSLRTVHCEVAIHGLAVWGESSAQRTRTYSEGSYYRGLVFLFSRALPS